MSAQPSRRSGINCVPDVKGSGVLSAGSTPKARAGPTRTIVSAVGEPFPGSIWLIVSGVLWLVQRGHPGSAADKGVGAFYNLGSRTLRASAHVPLPSWLFAPQKTPRGMSHQSDQDTSRYPSQRIPPRDTPLLNQRCESMNAITFGTVATTEAAKSGPHSVV
jgi:hypothetical protein